MLNCFRQARKSPKEGLQFFAYRNKLGDTMPITKKHSARRESMGGLAKGLAVIRAFTRERASLSLSEIARSAAMPTATARRCLLTLEELGYVGRYGREFVLRPKVLEL